VAADFNDDTWGRSPDQQFASGVTEVFAGVAQQALKTCGIEHRFLAACQRDGQTAAHE
jgi:hypothetical protein